MPKADLILSYAQWFKDRIAARRSEEGLVFELILPKNDLYLDEHQAIQSVDSSHLWRFKPSALVIELDQNAEKVDFHVLVATSSAIALKDVGELNCYARIMNAKSGCLVSPKGISNEVRLVQAEKSIRNRLFRPSETCELFLIEWNLEAKTVIHDSVIPIETEI